MNQILLSDYLSLERMERNMYSTYTQASETKKKKKIVSAEEMIDDTQVSWPPEKSSMPIHTSIFIHDICITD